MNKNFWNIGKGLFAISLVSAAIYGLTPSGSSGEGHHLRGGGTGGFTTSFGGRN